MQFFKFSASLLLLFLIFFLERVAKTQTNDELGEEVVPLVVYSDMMNDEIPEIGVPFQSVNSPTSTSACSCVVNGQCNAAGGLTPYTVPNIEIRSQFQDGSILPDAEDLETNGGLHLLVDEIETRVINRPPLVQCPAGQIYCCFGGGLSSSGYPGPGGGAPGGPGGIQGGNGYSACGRRVIINLPGFTPRYGQAHFGEYPWTAVILGEKQNNLGLGVLIDPYFVLTAAHKVSNWKTGVFMKVRLGGWDSQRDSEPYTKLEVNIANIHIHSDFNPNNLYNDVALIELKNPVDLKTYPHIKAACLPTTSPKFDGQRCWIAGFGEDSYGGGKYSTTMNEVDVPVVSWDECQNRLRSTRLGPSYNLDKNSFICAGGETGKDACGGDGGSPLVCEVNGQWTVAGLVAWGIGCGEAGIPGVYVNVQNFNTWIQSKIN